MPDLVFAICFALIIAAVVVALVVHRRRRRQREVFMRFNTMFGPVMVYSIKYSSYRLGKEGEESPGAATGEDPTQIAPSAANEAAVQRALRRDTRRAGSPDAEEPVRVMEIDGAYQSATYLDSHPYDLVFDYYKLYNHLFEADLPIRRVLMLGGGGYAYPKYLISRFPRIRLDVVEIDPAITAIAERYFFLDRLIAEYDAEETGRLNLLAEDGRAYLERTAVRYDAILNDCFAGRSPVMSLATQEAAHSIHAHLNPGGVYLSNVISSLTGDKSWFLQSVIATLGQVFAHVYVIPCGKYNPADRDNNMVIATDADYSFTHTFPVALDGRARVFHDREECDNGHESQLRITKD